MLQARGMTHHAADNVLRCRVKQVWIVSVEVRGMVVSQLIRACGAVLLCVKSQSGGMGHGHHAPDHGTWCRGLKLNDDCANAARHIQVCGNATRHVLMS